MELFNKNGCLTTTGITAILQNQLDEMQSLEASEHLAFCDSCLLRYTTELEKLCDTELLSPDTDITQTIMAKIRTRATRIFYSRYVTVIAAACFAIVFTFSGIFADMFGTNQSFTERTQAKISTAQEQVVLQENAAQAVREFFSLSFLKGDNNNEKK